jgi:hypothetical protein
VSRREAAWKTGERKIQRRRKVGLNWGLLNPFYLLPLLRLLSPSSCGTLRAEAATGKNHEEMMLKRLMYLKRKGLCELAWNIGGENVVKEENTEAAGEVRACQWRSSAGKRAKTPSKAASVMQSLWKSAAHEPQARDMRQEESGATFLRPEMQS